MTLPEMKSGLVELSGVPGVRVDGMLREGDELVDPPRCALAAAGGSKAITRAIQVLDRQEPGNIAASM
jgi:hypothetical protein